MRLIKWIDKWLCLHSKKYKLWRIGKAIGIKPWKWQRAFALGLTDTLGGHGRQCGKTMAIMLRLLMLPPDAEDTFMRYILGLDPDYVTSIARRTMWYREEYKKLSICCDNAGIPVVMLANDGLRTNFAFVDGRSEWGRGRGGT